MKNIIAIFFINLVLQSPVFSQDSWEENRKPYVIDEAEQDHALLYLYRGINYDYKFDDAGKFICDVTYHTIIKATNDEALESVNRIYIPMRNVIEILNVKSRAISPNGDITILDQNDIKEIKDEKSQGGYRIFAVEGAEVGGEIEYSYTKRVNGRTFINEVIQFTAPIRKLDFSLKCPENLEFDFFVANDTTSIVQIDDSEDINAYSAVFNDIPAIFNESFSALNANKKRIDFKVAYNSVTGSARINTFADAGKRILEGLQNLTKGEEKKLKKFISTHDNKSKDKVLRFKHFEHIIKSDFAIQEFESDDLESLITNKYGHKKGFVKLFIGVLQFLEMPFEVVITSDRNDLKFEKSFDHWNYLNDYLIFLPKQNEFIAPHSINYRYGIIPSQLTAVNGLFVKDELITDFKYPISKIDYVPESNYQQNMNNLVVDLSFDDDLTKNYVNVRREFIGEESTFYKFALQRVNAEQKEEMLDQLIQYLSLDSEINNVEIIDGDITEKGWLEPFVVKADFESENFLEQAGNSLLLKVGDLIGAQSELYQEDERVYEIENANNRGYDRKINIKIPKGYVIQNIEDIKIDQKVMKGDRVIFNFESKYKLNGDQLEITIDEFYDEIYYPAEQFEDFRRVINAAADFNKVVLVLKPA